MKNQLCTKIPVVWVKYFIFQFFVLAFFNINVKITRDVRTDIQHTDPKFRAAHNGSKRQQEQTRHSY